MNIESEHSNQSRSEDELLDAFQRRRDSERQWFERRRAYERARERAIRRGSSLSDEHELNAVRREITLSDEEISAHLKIKICSDKVEDVKDCAICIDDLYSEKDQKVGVLVCGHEYHPCCIKKWLQKKNECPICKRIALLLPIGLERCV